MLIYILFSLLKYNILFGAHKRTLAYLLRRRYILKIAFLNLTSQAVQRPADKKNKHENFQSEGRPKGAYRCTELEIPPAAIGNGIHDTLQRNNRQQLKK